MSESGANEEALDALRKEVLIHVGVSLARYQKIERGLKAVLPFLNVNGGKQQGDPFAEMHRLLASKSSMGPLMERLKERLSSSNPEQTARYLEEVIRHRNELVHHFFQRPVGRLDDERGCHEALQHIKTRLEYAQPLLELLKAAAGSLVEMIETPLEHSVH